MTSAAHVASTVFQTYVAEKTSGRYEVEIYPSAQLGNDVQLVKGHSRRLTGRSVEQGRPACPWAGKVIAARLADPHAHVLANALVAGA